MPSVLVPLAPGCEELEAVTIIDVLRRAEITVITASLDPGPDPVPVVASRGVTLVPDHGLDAVIEQTFDLIVLPGGLPGTDHLDQDPRIHQLVQRQQAAGRYTAAICAAPKVLAHAGILEGRHVTAYPGVLTAEEYPNILLCNHGVVTDNHIVTSRGPGTAMEFALTLVELLMGSACRQQVAEALLAS
jgi:4-methyl-5(b-hydroxyethyl)-thiazole monophosphate biosynthesis